MKEKIFELLTSKAMNLNKAEAIAMLMRSRTLKKELFKTGVSEEKLKEHITKIYDQWRRYIVVHGDFSINDLDNRKRCNIKTLEEREETIKNTVEKYNFKLLKIEHKDTNVFSTVTVECSQGHSWRVQYGRFRKSHLCPQCNFEVVRRGRTKTSDEYLKELFALDNYTFVEQFKRGNLICVSAICPKGHQHDFMLTNWKKGQRCPHCKRKGVKKR